MLKRQRFKDSKSDKIALKVEKCQRLNEYNNKEGQGLDKYDGEGEGDRYIFFAFITLIPLFQKELNRLSDLSKRPRSLNHLVCIPKIC